MPHNFIRKCLFLEEIGTFFLVAQRRIEFAFGGYR